MPSYAAAQHSVGPNVLVVRDVPYIEDGHERQRLDIYRMKDAAEPLPVIVWIHGGGWQNGSKANCLPLRAGYVQKGYAVVSVGYRLTDVAGFPAQTDDCAAAIRWVAEHADEHNLDADRIGVWGASAGGHLAAMAGLMPVKNDAGEGGEQRLPIKAVCDFFGPTDLMAFADASPRVRGPNSPEHKLLRGSIRDNPEKARQASPITYVDAGDPPVLIVHGDEDPLVPLDQSERLFKALTVAGVPVHLLVVKGGGHGRPGFAQEAVTGPIETFFAAHLKTQTPAALPPRLTATVGE